MDDPLLLSVLDRTRDERDRLARIVDVLTVGLDRIRGEMADDPADTARRTLELAEGLR